MPARDGVGEMSGLDPANLLGFLVAGHPLAHFDQGIAFNVPHAALSNDLPQLVQSGTSPNSFAERLVDNSNFEHPGTPAIASFSTFGAFRRFGVKHRRTI